MDNERKYREGQALLARAFSESKSTKRSKSNVVTKKLSEVVEKSIPSTAMSSKILKEGVLWKEGRHRNWTPAYGGIGMYPWKKRWVSVYDDGRIEWRTKRNQKNPNGSIHVNEYRVSEPSRTRDRKRYQLGLVANQVTKRDMKFQTDSMKSAMDWTHALVSSVGIPKFIKDTSGYRFICQLTRVETNKDAIAEIRPKYRTQKSARNEALQIGEGSFADVYVVTRLKDDVKLACKRVYVKPPDERLSHMDEIEIMRRMDHPFIVRCLDCYLTTNESAGNVAYLFMEYCDGGTVANRLKSLKGGVFRDSEAVRLARQILSAIGYMHAKGFVHRDVKLENMLYRTKAIDSPVVLVDFGISRNFRDKRKLMTSAVGSPWYLAPEQIKRLYDEKCDVWSLGVSIFWILSGHPPFGWREAANIQRKYKGKSDESRMDMLIGQAITKAIITAEEPPDCVAYGSKRTNPLAKAFLHKVLQPDPKQRLSALDALNEPWIHRSLPKVVLPTQVKKSLCALIHRDYFKTVALIVIAHTIDRTNLKQAFELYERIDSNGNGQISRKEWSDLLKSNGLPEHIANRTFDLIDFDGNGTLRVSEFVAATIDETKLLQPHMIEAAFEIIDSQHKGYITSKDVDTMLGYWDLGDDDDDDSVNKKDEGKLRRLTLTEFKKMMTGMSVNTSVISKPVQKWRQGIHSCSAGSMKGSTPLSQALARKNMSM